MRNLKPEARFPSKRNRLRCVRCVWMETGLESVKAVCDECLKGLQATFLLFTGETKKLHDYNQLLVTLIFGKITKYYAPNCPFTKLSCFLISVL